MYFLLVVRCARCDQIENSGIVSYLGTIVPILFEVNSVSFLSFLESAGEWKSNSAFPSNAVSKLSKLNVSAFR